MAAFAGWEMPIQYQGIVAEHQSVRDAVGVFDISHMGQLQVSGKQAAEALNSLLTNDCQSLEASEGQYTLMLNEGGGVIDDLIIYRRSADEFFLVVNASKLEKDVAWLKSKLPETGCELQDQSQNFGGIAVQGPKSEELWQNLAPDLPLPSRNGIFYGDDGLILCRTGYTGEDGFELFAPAETIGDWFTKVLDHGAQPCGLGARDSLRLEKCYPLNGNDLNSERTPLEAGLGFFVKLQKDSDFVGKSILIEQKQNGLEQRLVAIQMTGKCPPPRPHYEVIDPETQEVLSELTSGGQSPSLKIGIALAYLPSTHTAIDTPLEIKIRQRTFPAKVAKKPFLK